MAVENDSNVFVDLEYAVNISRWKQNKLKNSIYSVFLFLLSLYRNEQRRKIYT